MTNLWADIKNTDLVVIMGGNAAEAHPCGFKWVTEAKANRGQTPLAPSTKVEQWWDEQQPSQKIAGQLTKVDCVGKSARVWITPAGGMYCWLRFPDHVPTGPGSPLMEDSLREGVMYVPGEFCHVPDATGRLPTNEIRLCYGVATVAQIKEGVRRLAKAAKRLTALQEPAEETAELAAV